jgi:hypothetical protein
MTLAQPRPPSVRGALARILVGALICAGLGGPAHAAPASTGDFSPGAAKAFDFLVENVCLDKKGHVLVGVSPIDGDSRCVSQRNLQPGERLTYHERSWPDRSGGEGTHLRGSDSFPVNTRALGPVAIHIFDSDSGADPSEETFGRYDPGVQKGGGTIAALSNDTIFFAATQLGPQKLRLFIGKGCMAGQPITPEAVQDAWVLAPLDRLALLDIPAAVSASSDPIGGGVVTLPGGIVVDDDGARCPDRVHYGTTRWSIRPVAYRAVYKSGPNRGAHVRLWTLIAERTGQSAEEMDKAVHWERAYFTRELGWTRWEAWKSVNAPFRGAKRWAADTSAGPNARVMEAHDALLRRGNCELPEGVDADAAYALPVAPADSHGASRADLQVIGCIDVTNIVPPANKDGDPPPVGPGTWYGATVDRNNPLGAALFGP